MSRIVGRKYCCGFLRLLLGVYRRLLGGRFVGSIGRILGWIFVLVLVFDYYLCYFIIIIQYYFIN